MGGKFLRRRIGRVELPAHEARAHRSAREEQDEPPDEIQVEGVRIDRPENALRDAVLDDRPRRREEFQELGKDAAVEPPSTRQVLAEDDRGEGGTLGREPGERPDEIAEPRGGRRVRLADPGEARPDAAQALSDDRRIELLLSAEVVRNQGRVRRRISGDRVDGRSLEAVPRESRGRGCENACPGAVGVSGSRLGAHLKRSFNSSTPLGPTHRPLEERHGSRRDGPGLSVFARGIAGSAIHFRSFPGTCRPYSARSTTIGSTVAAARAGR